MPGLRGEVANGRVYEVRGHGSDPDGARADGNQDVQTENWPQVRPQRPAGVLVVRQVNRQRFEEGRVLQMNDLQIGVVHDLGELDSLEGLKVSGAAAAVNPVVGKFVNWPAMILDLQATTDQLKAANPGTWLSLRPDWNNLYH